jgi:hypothetical protein
VLYAILPVMVAMEMVIVRATFAKGDIIMIVVIVQEIAQMGKWFWQIKLVVVRVTVLPAAKA